jgi:hypothetical protein
MYEIVISIVRYTSAEPSTVSVSASGAASLYHYQHIMSRHFIFTVREWIPSPVRLGHPVAAGRPSPSQACPPPPGPAPARLSPARPLEEQTELLQHSSAGVEALSKGSIKLFMFAFDGAAGAPASTTARGPELLRWNSTCV